MIWGVVVLSVVASLITASWRIRMLVFETTEERVQAGRMIEAMKWLSSGRSTDYLTAMRQSRGNTNADRRLREFGDQQKEMFG